MAVWGRPAHPQNDAGFLDGSQQAHNSLLKTAADDQGSSQVNE
jgi:hypothetical protein